MRPDAILRLTRADLSLGRLPALAYSGGALAGALLAAGGTPTLRSLGLTLILNVLIGLCFHLPIVFVFQDITGGTRAFRLTLPVTPAEYAAAKLAAGALLFLVPAAAAALAVVLTPEAQRLFPPGLVLLMLLGWLIFFVQNLGLALLTESSGVTIAALLAEVFVVGNGALILAPRVPGLLRLWGGLEAGGPVRHLAFALLALELAGVVTLILFLMNRKRRFA